MIYTLVIFMLVKFMAVSWIYGYRLTILNYTRQLEITVFVTVIILSILGVQYIWDYPAPWDGKLLMLMFAYITLEILLLRGRETLSNIAYHYLYGKCKRREYRLRKVDSAMHPIYLGFYCVVGLGTMVLIH